MTLGVGTNAASNKRFGVTEQARQGWLEVVRSSYEGRLLNKVQRWITGYNSNLDGPEYSKTCYNIFAAGGAEYGKSLREAASVDSHVIVFGKVGGRRSHLPRSCAGRDLLGDYPELLQITRF